MYLADNKQHHLPHIHTRYQGQKASISIETGDVLDGDIPAT
jgi:desulfoferrodoxin (superoxide reductase-like protein)